MPLKTFAEDHDAHKSTVSQIISTVSKMITHKIQTFEQFPTDKEKVSLIIEKFYTLNIGKFACVYGTYMFFSFSETSSV